jgi:hypothetical protein
MTCLIPEKDLPDGEQRHCQRDPLQQFNKVSAEAKVNPDRRRFLVGSAVAGTGSVAAASIHDGELGAPWHVTPMEVLNSNRVE